MRLIKMVGLAAVCAIAAMAFLGASSASATHPTALCLEDPLPESLACPSGQLVDHVHFETEHEKALLLNDIQDVECTALFLGDVTTPGLLAKAGEWLTLLGHLSYGDCTTGCSATEVSKHAIIELLKLGHEFADVRGRGEVLVKCALILHCVYNGEQLVGHALGPLLLDDGHVTFEGSKVNKIGGILCPEEAFLDALFESLPEEPIYITS